MRTYPNAQALAVFLQKQVPARVLVTFDGQLIVVIETEADNEISVKTERIPATWEAVQEWLNR